jgi:hypothetical protein
MLNACSSGVRRLRENKCVKTKIRAPFWLAERAKLRDKDIRRFHYVTMTRASYDVRISVQVKAYASIRINHFDGLLYLSHPLAETHSKKLSIWSTPDRFMQI